MAEPTTVTEGAPAPTGDSSYMQSLLDPAQEIANEEPAVEAVVEPAEAATTQPVEAQQPQVTKTATPEEVEALVEQFAKEHGLDPTNLDPTQRNLLKRLADKEAYVRYLDTAKPAAPAAALAREMSAFERSLLGDEAEKPAEVAKPAAAAEPPKPEPQPAPQTGFGDIGDKWAAEPNPEVAAYNDWNQALADGDFARLSQINRAIFRRNFVADALPAIQKMSEEIASRVIQEQLGDVMPDIRRTSEVQRDVDYRNQAVAELRKDRELGPVIDDLYRPQSEQKIMVHGQQVADTPLNRILLENPWIAETTFPGKNERATELRTTYKQLEIVARLYLHGKTNGPGATPQQPSNGNGKTPVAPDTAQQLLEEGRKIGERTAQDRLRQGINAGASAASATDGEGTYVSELVNLPGSRGLSTVAFKR